MFLSTAAVKDWQDLQVKVAEFFNEMGYDAKPDTVSFKRGGQANVDVVVRDHRGSVPKTYLIECKYWDSNVSRAAVQSLKMDVWEAGANFGIFVSKNGFQPGAEAAADGTNISLVTWEDLQHTYGNEWFAGRRNALLDYVQKIRNIFDQHFDQFNPIVIFNNMFFFLPEHYRRLVILNHWGGHLLLAFWGTTPSSYMGPEPITISGFPNSPERYEANDREDWTSTYATVRDFFFDVEAGMKRFLAEFEALRKEAHEAFELLSDEEQDRNFSQMYRNLAEESPIRTYRDTLGADYEVTLLKHIASPQPRISKAD